MTMLMIKLLVFEHEISVSGK